MFQKKNFWKIILHQKIRLWISGGVSWAIFELSCSFPPLSAFWTILAVYCQIVLWLLIWVRLILKMSRACDVLLMSTWRKVMHAFSSLFMFVHVFFDQNVLEPPKRNSPEYEKTRIELNTRISRLYLHWLTFAFRNFRNFTNSQHLKTFSSLSIFTKCNLEYA